MRPIDFALGAILVLACSSDRDPSPGGTTTGPGGNGGSNSHGGGLSTGGAAGGQGGGGNEPPAGGEGAIVAWMIDTCANLLDSGCPEVTLFEPGHSFSGFFCDFLTVEVLPDTLTCNSGVIEGVCVPRFPGASGGCSTMDCPAQPAPHYYLFRERPSGEVELNHVTGDYCGWAAPPIGFTECQMKPTDPEACICNCEL